MCTCVHQVLEKEIHSAVSKLMTSQDGMEGIFTCMSCVDLFKDPVMCVPCGHSCCRACLAEPEDGHPGRCQECDEEVTAEISNASLDTLQGKFIFARKALTVLNGVVEQLKQYLFFLTYPQFFPPVPVVVLGSF